MQTMVKHTTRPGDKKIDDRIEFNLPTYESIRCLILSDQKILLRGPVKQQKLPINEFYGVEISEYQAPIDPIAPASRTAELRKAMWQEVVLTDNSLQDICKKLARHSWGSYCSIAVEFARVHKSFVLMEFADFDRLNRVRMSAKEPVVILDFLSEEESRAVYLDDPDTYNNIKVLKKLLSDTSADERVLKSEMKDWKSFAGAGIEQVESRILMLLAKSVRIAANRIQIAEHKNSLLRSLKKDSLCEDTEELVKRYDSLMSCLIGSMD